MGKAKKKVSEKKVLHLCRFHERYELSEDIRYDRKSPLLFTKDFVGSGNDSESCSFFLQLMALRSKPNWLEYRGGFAELKNIAGNTSKVYRGFLLNSNFEPASVREIGRWLGVNEKRAGKVIGVLEEIGLVEWLDLPVFETDETKNKPKKRKRKSPAKRTKANSRKSGRSRKRTENSGRARAGTEKPGGARARTGRHGNARAPLKEKTNVNENVNVKEKTNGNGKSFKEEIIKRQSSELNSNALKGQAKGRTTTTPATALPMPIKPRDSAGSGGRVLEFPKVPPTAVSHNRDRPEKIGDVIGAVKHRWDMDSREFGADVYLALKLPWDPTSSRGKRELACFGSLWMGAKASSLSPPVLDELRVRALTEAKKIAKRRRRCSNVSAVWVFVFNRLLAAAGGVAARGDLGGCG